MLVFSHLVFIYSVIFVLTDVFNCLRITKKKICEWLICAFSGLWILICNKSSHDPQLQSKLHNSEVLSAL